MSEETNTQENTQPVDAVETAETPQTQPDNLLDTPGATPETSSDATGDEARPEWLPEKFKSPEDFAKSYTELEKKIGAQAKAPEEYDYGFIKDMGLEMTDEQQKEANSVFKSYGLTQDQMKGMMALYSDSVQQLQEQMQGPKIDSKAEMQLVKDTWSNTYDAKMEATRNFAKNLKQETLAAPLASTAEGLQILHDAMQYRNGPNPMAPGSTSAVTRTTLLDQARDMMNDPKYKLPQGDPVGDAHRNEMYRLYQQMERLPAEK
tara:strand:- start:7406 stop:8191 length:786 start_codon:yes stop_codon:yes gene_type:complete